MLTVCQIGDSTTVPLVTFEVAGQIGSMGVTTHDARPLMMIPRPTCCENMCEHLNLMHFLSIYTGLMTFPSGVTRMFAATHQMGVALGGVDRALPDALLLTAPHLVMHLPVLLLITLLSPAPALDSPTASGPGPIDP